MQRLCVLAIVLFVLPLACGSATQAKAEQVEDIQSLRDQVKVYALIRSAWNTYMQGDQAQFAEDDGLLDDDFELSEEARGHYLKAIELSLKALDLRDKVNDANLFVLADAHLIIANSFHNLDQPAKTEQHYTNALKIDPARDDILSARVGIRIELKDWRGAQADVDLLAELESEYAEPSARELKQARNEG